MQKRISFFSGGGGCQLDLHCFFFVFVYNVTSSGILGDNAHARPSYRSTCFARSNGIGFESQGVMINIKKKVISTVQPA